MNKRAQGGPVSYIFSILFFLIFIAIMGGTLWGIFALAASIAGLTGIEGFILNNFAIIVILSVFLGTIAFFSLGGR